MADITYPNRNTGAGLAKPDIAAVRFIEFEVDFSKLGTTASGDNILLGVLPKGSIVYAATAQVLVAGGTAATMTLKAGATAIGAALTTNATAGTIYANAVTGGPLVMTADTTVQATLGVAAGSGIQRFVIVASEAVKASYPKLAVRDQTTGTA